MESIMGVYAGKFCEVVFGFTLIFGTSGYSLRGETVPEADIGPYVEEAINQVSPIEPGLLLHHDHL